MDSPLEPPPSPLKTPRTTLKRHAERGSHERALIDAILDEALVCHAAAVIDGVPCVLPTAHVRVGDAVYLHGARANRLMRAMCEGPVCVTVTLLDGLTFSRSAFSHSMNYRSAVIYGRAHEVTDAALKREVLHALVEHIAPGRSLEALPPTEAELSSTLVIGVPIEEASAKTRKGPPLDAGALLEHPCWAGELPLKLVALAPRPDAITQASGRQSVAMLARAQQLGSAAEPQRP